VTADPPAFAEDAPTQLYYERRAQEYDEWYLGEGLFSGRDRPGWQEELAQLCAALAGLEPVPTLDVACGTAFLSRHLTGRVVGVDRSPAMVRIARGRVAAAAVADALALPIAADAVMRVFTAHFYGHLSPGERGRFLGESRRVCRELVVVDTAQRPGMPDETWQERVLNDGSRHRVFKRFLGAEQLASEIGGSVVFAGRWFVGARATLLHR
jgi:ubiquinone/menaquinone biosynthesis C-methylase UbiE